jgi:transposase-like protein
VSALNKKIYETIATWHNRPIEGDHPCFYLDGIVMKRGPARFATSHCWWRLRSTLILGVCEVAKDDKADWWGFLKLLNERVLKSVRLIIGRLHGACRERRRVDSRARALSVPPPTANWR